MASELFMRHPLPDGREIEIEVRRRRNSRNIRIHLERDGHIWLSAPVWASEADIRHAVCNAESWFENGLRALEDRNPETENAINYRGYPCKYLYRRSPSVGIRVEEGTSEKEAVVILSGPTLVHAQKAFRKWWQEEACRIIRRNMKKWESLLIRSGKLLPQFRIRPLRKSWGICYPEKNLISLNEMLLSVPERLMEYVVLHETAHLIHPNHGPEFKALLTAQMPDWKERRDLLKNENPVMGEMTFMTV